MSGPPVISRTVTVKNPNGLHLRPWSLLVKMAYRYTSKIEIVKDECPRMDARSIISLLALGAKCGDVIVVEAQGDDAEAAVASLADFLDTYVEPEESEEQR